MAVILDESLYEVLLMDARLTPLRPVRE